MSLRLWIAGIVLWWPLMAGMFSFYQGEDFRGFLTRLGATAAINLLIIGAAAAVSLWRYGL